VRSLALLLLVAANLAAAPGRASELVADISDHLVAVTTGFVGTRLLLFGAIEDAGEVIVVTRGPDQVEAVRRKERIAGIWVNTDEQSFTGVPAFYALAASAPLADIASEAELRRNEIGLATLRLAPAPGATEADVQRFREALLRLKVSEGLYSGAPARVEFLGSRLFRADIVLPANVPTGVYRVTVYLLREGSVVSAQTTPLIVSKIGIGASIAAFALQESAAYGLLAIVLALFAGWAAGLAFRRV